MGAAFTRTTTRSPDHIWRTVTSRSDFATAQTSGMKRLCEALLRTKATRYFGQILRASNANGSYSLSSHQMLAQTRGLPLSYLFGSWVWGPPLDGYGTKSLLLRCWRQQSLY